VSAKSQQRAINKRRESAEHQAKRDRIREQVASGELVIRKATAEERRRFKREREQSR
jgi:hypothetical protein